jgi:hypothetical protein
MNLLNILNNPVTRVFSFLLFIGFCITIAYYKGYSACERDLTFKLQGAMIENNNRIIETERRLKEEQDKIVADYLNKIEVMQNEHKKDIVDLNNLRDTVNVHECMSNSSKTDKSVSGKAKDKSGVRCYTEAELQRKIEASLDIAGEADLMFEKYVALLKACKVGDK